MAGVQVMLGLTVKLGKDHPASQCPKGGGGSAVLILICFVGSSQEAAKPACTKFELFCSIMLAWFALEQMTDRSPSAADRVG